ncbi:uncharacterized protein PFL1_00140 [Pseudozyma flocculosa PF-1]|uniref:Uncharacterized protein n=1 Tax=Pseudozyma flocculosa TaxID=84751 RepID=A0A5C3EUC9_9BASI|nr:uncharacterized protein PFL1_00140 [Pseudozyma flocculosa PF-1]EPQ31941.1 hypothetical protein PFL1_00140 [Pseudozyma flocculosa PF-1]SPO35146.1 uncharacterized protein PSFLO_00617 [Pseudozyma flocculosa]
MALFSSSNSSQDSGSSGAPATVAPTRSERQACWTHRDAYFGCLTRNKVTIPPGTDMSDGRGAIGKAAKEEQERLQREKNQSVEEARKADPCIQEREGYEQNCARSWIDYFNKRRVLEERQKMMYAQGGPQPAAK